MVGSVNLYVGYLTKRKSGGVRCFPSGRSHVRIPL